MNDNADKRIVDADCRPGSCLGMWDEKLGRRPFLGGELPSQIQRHLNDRGNACLPIQRIIRTTSVALEVG